MVARFILVDKLKQKFQKKIRGVTCAKKIKLKEFVEIFVCHVIKVLFQAHELRLSTSQCKDKRGTTPNFYKDSTEVTCNWFKIKKSEREEICKNTDLMNHCKKTCNNCP